MMRDLIQKLEEAKGLTIKSIRSKKGPTYKFQISGDIGGIGLVDRDWETE